MEQFGNLWEAEEFWPLEVLHDEWKDVERDSCHLRLLRFLTNQIYWRRSQRREGAVGLGTAGMSCIEPLDVAGIFSGLERVSAIIWKHFYKWSHKNDRKPRIQVRRPIYSLYFSQWLHLFFLFGTILVYLASFLQCSRDQLLILPEILFNILEFASYLADMTNSCTDIYEKAVICLLLLGYKGTYRRLGSEKLYYLVFIRIFLAFRMYKILILRLYPQNPAA